MKIKSFKDPDFKVICDFDGTISKNDTFDQLLERFADPIWQDIEADWVKGKIGTAECMRRQVELVKISKRQLDNWLSFIQIDVQFINFVKFCQKLNIEISIASDGIDYLIKKILAHYGLNSIQVSANQLIFKEKNKMTLAFSEKLNLCDSKSMVCKCSIAVAHKKSGKKIVYVGDGHSDYCVSKRIDLVLAKANLLAYCKQHELPHYAIDDFSDVMMRVKQLIRQPESVIEKNVDQKKQFFKSLNS